jgi:Domain of unknown function (DUF305)
LNGNTRLRLRGREKGRIMNVNRIALPVAATILAPIRKWLSYRVSLRISPMLIVLAITAVASCGVIVSWARVPRPPEDAPAGFDPKSLADFLAALCTQSYRASFPVEAPFLGGNALAMSKMMSGMAITPSGNTDADFVHMMVSHHQGAIDMAVLEIRYGENPILKRLAQEIIVDQQQEITAMYLAIHEPLPASAPAPTWQDAASSSVTTRTGH